MPDRTQAAYDFLRTRRSRPWRSIAAPAPDDAELTELMTIAARVPDHGKLEPFRFVVLRAPALRRIAECVATYGAAQGRGTDEIAKAREVYDQSPLAIAVVEAPRDSAKIPLAEQQYAAACACFQLLNAALAAGWAANWLSGWLSHDARFCGAELGLAGHERLVGLVHIGTETSAPPERPRPDVPSLITWVDA